MSFAQLSFRESLRDIEHCLSSVQHKLYHCGIRSHVARNTLAKANETRSWNIYAGMAEQLMKIAIPLYKGDNRLSKELQTTIYAFDSTTIDLCLKLFPWATFSSTRKAIKVHVLINVDGYIPEFIQVTTANKQDVILMDDLQYRPGCFYLMDKAYVDFDRLYRINCSKAYFVTRAKENMSYIVKESRHVKPTSGIIKDEIISLQRWHTKRWYPENLRRIEYADHATGNFLVFITNHLLLEADTIALLYKERWKVELFFKWIKQNLRIKKFYGNSENAVKTQIWIAVCNYLQVAILKKHLQVPLPLSQMLQIISLSLFDKCPLETLFTKQETTFISNQASLFTNLTGH